MADGLSQNTPLGGILRRDGIIAPMFRTAVLLADVEGMTYEEIADAMSTSVGTVRSRIHRGRKQIRTHLLNHANSSYRGYADDLQ